jgi:hypothetical protein
MSAGAQPTQTFMQLGCDDLPQQITELRRALDMRAVPHTGVYDLLIGAVAIEHFPRLGHHRLRRACVSAGRRPSGG